MLREERVNNAAVVAKALARRLLGRKRSAQEVFLSYEYQRHNQRRLEHLASLGLEISGMVLEVGAGIGDHTSFFLDRGCQVVTTDARPENLRTLSSRYPNVPVHYLDLDNPDPTMIGGQVFDIVYCYGLLYHLSKPAEAVEFMARHCRRMLLLETCVSYGETEAVNPVHEPRSCQSQAVSGRGCRPTRQWVYNRLQSRFPHVYMPVTQPNHEEFPTDWSTRPSTKELTRAVFIGSTQPLNNPLLVGHIPMQQRRH